MHHVTEVSAHSAPKRGAVKWAPVHRSKGVEGSGAGSVSRGSEDQQPAHPLRSFWRLAGGFWGRGIVVLDEATAALDLPSQDQYSASPRKGVMYVCDNEVGRAAQMRLSLRLKSCKDRNETSSLSEDAQQNSRSATWRTSSCQTRRTCRRH